MFSSSFAHVQRTSPKTPKPPPGSCFWLPFMWTPFPAHLISIRRISSLTLPRYMCCRFRQSIRPTLCANIFGDFRWSQIRPTMWGPLGGTLQPTIGQKCQQDYDGPSASPQGKQKTGSFLDRSSVCFVSGDTLGRGRSRKTERDVVYVSSFPTPPTTPPLFAHLYTPVKIFFFVHVIQHQSPRP